MKPFLELQNIHFNYGERALINNISFDLNGGEIFVILGRNGAGKSTLLNLITGELAPNKGAINIFSQDLSSFNQKELAKKRAVLTQSTPLSFDYSVLEVVLLGRLPHSKESSFDLDYEIARNCLDKVGLLHFEDRGYLSLSGGEQQRVHLARVLAQLESKNETRKIFLLDEPTNHLDLLYQHETLQILKDLKEQNIAVLAILHDLNLASQYADRMMILKDGGILSQGTPQEVLTVDNIYEGFGYKALVIEHPEKKCPLVI